MPQDYSAQPEKSASLSQFHTITSVTAVEAEATDLFPYWVYRIYV